MNRTRTRSVRRRLLLLAILLPVTLGVVASSLFDEGSTDGTAGTFTGSLHTSNIHGVPVTGCVTVCPEYNIDTKFSTRLSSVSQFAALVPGRTHAAGDLFLNGFAGTLVDVDGGLLVDLRTIDPALETVFKRILSGVVADFDNDGYNEIVYGLNSYNLFASEEDVRYRQRRSFEILRTGSEGVRGYAPVNETAFPMGECPPGGTSHCTGYYDWRIDGDVTNVAAADFDNDGWLDIAYLGTSLGDHSWIGFATDLAAAGIPLSNENGARVGVALNRGEAEPGVFTWPRETSQLETHLRKLYPFSDEVDYAPKSQRLFAKDIDGDGNVDLLVVGEKVVVAWGDGAGRFSSVDTVLDTPGGSDAAVADFDNDGSLDLFVLANSQPRYIDLPRIGCTPQPECAERGRNEGGLSVLYLSDGQRRFSKYLEFQGLKQATSVSAVDVNSDSWLDVVLTCVSCVGPGVLQARVADGALQGYDLRPLVPGEGITFMQKSVALDIDEDGDTDILLSGSREVFRQVWVNGPSTSLYVSFIAAGVLLLVVATGLVLLYLRRSRVRDGTAS
jgi:hypothetical protein